MGSGCEAGSYLRLIDFVYHSTLGLRVIKKKKKSGKLLAGAVEPAACQHRTLNCPILEEVSVACRRVL